MCTRQGNITARGKLNRPCYLGYKGKVGISVIHLHRRVFTRSVHEIYTTPSEQSDWSEFTSHGIHKFHYYCLCSTQCQHLLYESDGFKFSVVSYNVFVLCL